MVTDAADTAARPEQAFFSTSLLPMLIADDQRRYVDANRAACLLLRLPRAEVLKLRIDDLTVPEARAQMGARWRAFLQTGTRAGSYDMVMPDGPRITLGYSAMANFRPGLHISILELTPTDPQPQVGIEDLHRPEGFLSEREREVMARVAMGETSQAIGDALHISVTTIDTHIRNSLAKLSAKNRAHAIALAIKRGEITLS